MGIGGRGYEGCNLVARYRTRGSIPYFSEEDIFDLKFNNKKNRSSDVLASIQRALLAIARTSLEQFARTRVEKKTARTRLASNGHQCERGGVS